MNRTEKGWIEEYQKKGALWIHDGNPKRPHALLTSGKHSSGFFNSELIMENPRLLSEACADLLSLLEKREHVQLDTIDRVVGPAMGAITMAHELARHISEISEHVCLRAYTEKISETDKTMVFKRTSIGLTESVLLCEDVLTTGGSVNLAIAAVAANHGYVAAHVLVLVNRSGLKVVKGKTIVSLIDKPMPIWEPHECPLCKQGSEAIKPKAADNWKRLNATY